MCYEKKCSSCGKMSWEGCGRHVPSVYSRISQGQHCLCKDWPGVTKSPNSAATGESATTNGESATTNGESASTAFTCTRA